MNGPVASHTGSGHTTIGASVARGVKAAIALLLLAGVGLMFANVVARHFFDAPFYWAEEAAVYMNVWCVFLGAVLVSLENAHLRMDLLVSALSVRHARWLNVLSLVATLIACAVVSVGSWALLKQLWRADLRSVAIGMPMVVPHAAVFVGFVAMLIVTALTWRRVVDGSSERNKEFSDDPGELELESSK